MKTRNLLLALACVVLFVFGGVLYFKTWVVQKPFAIILFTGDGLTSSSLAAARIYGGGAQNKLFVESMPNVALLKNSAVDFAIADDAASATTLATGRSVNNGTLSIHLTSILEKAAKAGRRTGIVTNGNLTAPGTAAFYAHLKDAKDQMTCAEQLTTYGYLDLMLGGGEKFFLPLDKGGLRSDGKDLVLGMKQKRYEVVRTQAEMLALPTWRSLRTFGVFDRDELSYSRQVETVGTQPSLEQMVRWAIQNLQNNARGYVLVVDAGLIETAARDNEGENYLSETIELDRAIRTARDYAGRKALILATAKEAPGGLRLNGYPLHRDQGAGILGINAQGLPSLTWSSGPHAQPAVRPSLTSETSPLSPETATTNPSSSNLGVEPAAVFSEQSLNVADDPLAFGLGPGSEPLKGCKPASIIFKIMSDSL